MRQSAGAEQIQGSVLDLFVYGRGKGTLARVAGVECRKGRRIARAAIWSVAPALLVGVLAASGPLLPAAATPAPTQSQIDAQQQQVQQLEATIASQQQQGDLLTQRYDAAEQQLASAQAALASTQAAIIAIRSSIAADKQRLARVAVQAYVTNVPDTSLTELFTVSAAQADAAKVYQKLAVADLNAATDALTSDQAKLNARQAQQVEDQQQAASSAASAQSLADTNTSQTQSAQATLAQAQGVLSQDIAAYAAQQAQIAAARAAAAATAAAAAKAVNTAAAAASVANAVSGAPNATADTAAAQAAASAGFTVSKGTITTSAGAAAVSAALSQLGVPYVFGGTRSTATPPPGFDCSGLTQWAWAQAGVSIPRTSEDQWAGLPHVSLTDLEPGDLIFTEGSPPGHVVMFVGSGPYGSLTVVQAPHTGTNVSYSSALYLGAITGAARP
jgi:cell wall-associated NlpC family hydrolase